MNATLIRKYKAYHYLAGVPTTDSAPAREVTSERLGILEISKHVYTPPAAHDE